MISEASCDPEDWSNDAEDSASHHRNQLHLKKIILNCNKYFRILLFILYCILIK